MKISIFLYLAVYILVGCQHASKGAKLAGKLYVGSGLCKIAPVQHNLEVFELDQKNEPVYPVDARESSHVNKPFLKKKYSYRNPDIDFGMYYSMDYESILIEINNQWLRCEGNEYFRPYSKGYIDGLHQFTYQNYLVKTRRKEFLVLRTYSANNSIAALHTIYFIIDVTNDDDPILYSVGSYGYCDNGLGDFNGDGELDVILINQVSIYDPPLDPSDPRGEFRASVFTLNKGEIVPLEKHGHQLACSFKTDQDSISLLSGIWFDN